MKISKVKLKVIGGKGGEGAISFRREKFIEFGGPDGGNGGKGGDVYLQVKDKMENLLPLAKKSIWIAQGGKQGSGSQKHGKKGEDLVLFVPPGTQCYIQELDYNLTINDRVLIAKGGKGGIGNSQLSTPTNKTPRYRIDAQPSEERTLFLSLRILGDVGILGKPNVGKSTLFNALTGSKAVVGNYEFTTLKPKLGTEKQFKFKCIDLPGIIKGAASGKGLGLQFLEQIEKSKLLIMLIDISKNPLEDFYALKAEIDSYRIENNSTTNQPLLIVFSKCDLVKRKTILEITKTFFKTTGYLPLYSSALYGGGLNKLRLRLHKLIKPISNNVNSDNKSLI